MHGTTPLDEFIIRAYELAYFIHGEKETSLCVVVESLAKLEIAASAQDKRLYYTPKAERPRSKVSASEEHLLQRLVYAESEPYEREAERRFLTEDPDEPPEEAMIIHFIKHLARITIKRNSFYVTLGVSRLLHHYSTAETMELYNVVVQDPDRVRDDYYYRSRKKQLMQELKDRFGEMLRISRGARGEERFQSDDCPADCPNGRAQLVRDCLRRFTPWNTACALPAKFDPHGEPVAALAFDGADPDAEHKIEANRFHAVIDPDCFERLTAGVNLAAPAAQLAVPLFSIARREDDDEEPRPPRSRRAAALEGGELDAIKRQLAAESSRRKRFSVAALRVLVDGAERARFDPNRAGRVEFQVEEGAELIEVRTAVGDDLLLATHLLQGGEAQGAKETAIVLEGGQRLSFRVSPIADALGEPEGASIEVAYRETQVGKATALWLRQRAAAIAEPLRQDLPVVKPALAFAVLAALAVGLTFFWRSPRPSPTPDIASASPTPTVEVAPPSPPVAPVRRSPVAAAPEPRKQEPPKPLIANTPDQPPSRTPDEPVMPDTQPGEDAGLRSGGKGQGPVSLARVKSIHVDPFAPLAEGQVIRDAVTTALRAVPNLTVAPSRNDADAVLKGTIVAETPDGAGQATLRVRIVHASGDVVWPANRQWKEYKGTADEIARELAGELREDLRKARRRMREGRP